MNEQTDILIDNKHCYFLNLEQAYIQAEKKQWLSDEQGQKIQQYCYYSGALTDILLPSLIQVDQSQFVDFFSNNQLPVPELVIYENGNVLNLATDSPDILDDINRYRQQLKPDTLTHKDLYFVDRLEALNTAKQKNRVNLRHPTIDGLQICFYHGEPLDTEFENLVHVPFNELIAFFSHTRLRHPAEIRIPQELDSETKNTLNDNFKQAFEAINQNIEHHTQQLFNQARQLKPEKNDKVLKVFLPSNRLTQVMQYSSQNIAKGFNSLGHKTFLHLEENDMQAFTPQILLEDYIQFNPDIVFQINHLTTSYIHDDVINITWYQDRMLEIINGEPLVTRKNDYILSLTPYLDHYIKQAGVNTIYRQHFTIDDTVFNEDYDIPRTNKIIFIGSSYSNNVNLQAPNQQKLIEQLAALIQQKQCIDKNICQQLANTADIDPDYIFWRLLHFVIRDYSVKWLCELDNTPPEIEIYGRFWNYDSIIQPYFKGELEHGSSVARAYNSARYALVSHPFEINSQRLVEASACGCIPIVYDCREIAEQPHWDKHCLFFKNKEELEDIISRQLEPENDPREIARQFSHTSLAQHCLDIINTQETEARRRQ